MKANQDSTDVLQGIEVEEPSTQKSETNAAFAELEKAIHAALETYSNVHRGSGHFTMVTTHLFEQARDIILEYLNLDKGKYVVIFCTPRRAASLQKELRPESFQIISSQEIGLSIGVTALAVQKNALPTGAPFQTGGGTARLMSKEWVVWARSIEKFEAGTPAIINIIAFAKGLRLIQRSGKNIFKNPTAEKVTASELLHNDELEKFTGQELLNELRQTMIGRSVAVPTMEGIRPFINLDNSASTPTFTPIWNAFSQTLHQTESVKQEIIQKVKLICAKTLNAPLSKYDVIFTSNTTEAINLAAESVSREDDEFSEPVVMNTLLEHSSNDLPWRMIPNCSLIRLSVNDEGFVDLNELENLLISYNQLFQHGKKRIKIIAVSGASNVLGVCNNLSEIGRIIHKYGARLLVDAAQLVAHRKIDMEKCGIDYLAFSAHKVYAPFGCGALVVRKDLLNLRSEEVSLIRSSGEENAAGIAALGKALVLLQRIGMDLIGQEEQYLTSRLLKGLSTINNLEIFGIKDPDSTQFAHKIGVVPFNLKNTIATKAGKELALQSGIGVRTGCHCAHIMTLQPDTPEPVPKGEKIQRAAIRRPPVARIP
jgi:selenocysteine lyase/cysteine desulfurase